MTLWHHHGAPSYHQHLNGLITCVLAAEQLLLHIHGQNCCVTRANENGPTTASCQLSDPRTSAGDVLQGHAARLFVWLDAVARQHASLRVCVCVYMMRSPLLLLLLLRSRQMCMYVCVCLHFFFLLLLGQVQLVNG
jgi:hypothetical protein